MTIEISVPGLPESVSDALLLDWRKQAGDRVHRDEIIVELETDKIVLEVVAPADGVISEILQKKGSTVTAGEVLAKMTPSTDADTAPPQTGMAEMPVGKTGKNTTDNRDRNANAQQKPSAPVHANPPMSPTVRRMVEEHGLNPSDIRGSGSGGRIIKEDILSFIGTQAAPDSTHPAAPSAAPESATAERQQTREPMSRLRQTIAARMRQAQQTAALLTTFNQVNMQPVLELRAKYRDEFEKTHHIRLGFMSFFIKASVAALQKFPLLNASIDGADIVRHHYQDIGIAVSSKRGLVVPVVRDCERLSFAEIESQIRAFSERAGTGKLSLDELSGATFTITNGGVFGSLLSTPIVNPPQSAILGMHKIEQRPVAENGQVVIRPMMYLALSYDHRLIDGEQAVQFLVTIKELLESPARMLLQI